MSDRNHDTLQRLNQSKETPKTNPSQLAKKGLWIKSRFLSAPIISSQQPTNQVILCMKVFQYANSFNVYNQKDVLILIN